MSGSKTTLSVTSARLIICWNSLLSSLVSVTVLTPPPPSSTTAKTVKGSGTVPVGIVSVIIPDSSPLIGKIVVGSEEPYEYLIGSIDKFYAQNELAELLKKNKFSNVEFRNLSSGISAIHSGWKI